MTQTPQKLTPHILAMVEAAHALKIANPELWLKFLSTYADWLDVELNELIDMKPSEWLSHQQGRVKFAKTIGMLFDECSQRLKIHRELVERTPRPPVVR